MRLPTRIHFPFGFVIRVKQITKREIEDMIGYDALAGWVSSDRTIYLTRSRGTKLKRGDLAHELAHAIVDYTDFLLTNGIAKV